MVAAREEIPCIWDMIEGKRMQRISSHCQPHHPPSSENVAEADIASSSLFSSTCVLSSSDHDKKGVTEASCPSTPISNLQARGINSRVLTPATPATPATPLSVPSEADKTPPTPSTLKDGSLPVGRDPAADNEGRNGTSEATSTDDHSPTPIPCSPPFDLSNVNSCFVAKAESAPPSALENNRSNISSTTKSHSNELTSPVFHLPHSSFEHSAVEYSLTHSPIYGACAEGFVESPMIAPVIKPAFATRKTSSLKDNVQASLLVDSLHPSQTAGQPSFASHFVKAALTEASSAKDTSMKSEDQNQRSLQGKQGRNNSEHRDIEQSLERYFEQLSERGFSTHLEPQAQDVNTGILL